jgi:Flp pilus assembly protein TadG
MAEAGNRSWRRRVARLCGLRTLRRLGTNDDAATAVEFSLVALPFFLVLFAIFETGLFLWAGQTLDAATAASARLILTGQVQNQGITRDQFKNDLCSRVIGLIDCEGGVLIDVQTYNSWSDVNIGKVVDSSGNLTVTGQTFQTGGPGSIEVVRAIYLYPILVRSFGLDLADLPGGKRLIVSTVAFQNEPYSTTGSSQ